MYGSHIARAGHCYHSMLAQRNRGPSLTVLREWKVVSVNCVAVVIVLTLHSNSAILDTTQSFHITTLMCTDRKVLVGTTVGMVAIFDSETTNLLNCFNWHKDKVRTLLAMPREVEPCVCAEVPFPYWEAGLSDGHSTMNDQSILITRYIVSNNRLILACADVVCMLEI